VLITWKGWKILTEQTQQIRSKTFRPTAHNPSPPQEIFNEDQLKHTDGRTDGRTDGQT